MANDNDDGLSFEWKSAGRNGTAIVTAKLAGEAVAVESLNLTKSKARADFAKAVCDGRPGIDLADVENELLQMADELARRHDKDEPADLASLPEVDASRLIRPERFITQDVCGLAVPTMTTLGDSVAGRWQLYLRWPDGKRERRPLRSTVDLSDGGRLFVHPLPGEPSPTQSPGWSAESRQRWLEGEPASNAADVFKRLAERFAYFIDLPRQHAPGVTATLVLRQALVYGFTPS